MWENIKAWYFKTFLPFEDPDHPLNTGSSDPFCEEMEEWIEAELDSFGPYPDEGIGPNYKEHFSKPKTYKKWGDKWYKSDS